MRKVLIAGATRAMAQATARLMAARGDRLFLAGRYAVRLEMIAQDLRARGAGSVASMALDLNDWAAHPQLVETGAQALEGLDTLLLA